jgi:outer membrane protein OmpA-like peptidoglycan-associated protein
MKLAVAVLLVTWAGVAHADKAGCTDPAWAKSRYPAYTIADCSTKPWGTMDLELTSGRKTLEGEITTVNYDLTDDAKNAAAKKVLDFFAAAGTKAGGKVVSGESIYNVVLQKGDTYYVYSHGSGNEDSTGSFTLITIKLAKMPQSVVAKMPAAALDTKADKCEDPPWLVKGMPGYKLTTCTPRDVDEYTFSTADGEKTLVGKILDHEYTLTDDSKNAVALLVQRNFIAALEKIGAKLLTNRDDMYHAVLMQKTSHGDLWYLYQHGSGNEDSTGSYTLTTIEVGGPPPKQCKLEIYGVNFDTDKATLKPESDPVLQQVVAMFKADAKLAGELSGHTDDVGDKGYNQKLSQQRADAVKAWLVAHGVDAARVTTKGYGDTKPLVPNTSDPNRAKNRRVELARNNCK